MIDRQKRFGDLVDFFSPAGQPQDLALSIKKHSRQDQLWRSITIAGI
jgi:hypothetical protein